MVGGLRRNLAGRELPEEKVTRHAVLCFKRLNSLQVLFHFFPRDVYFPGECNAVFVRMPTTLYQIN